MDLRILHITAMGHNFTVSGLPAVIKPLVEYQNLINNVSAKVISLKSNTKELNSPFFYDVFYRKTSNFIDSFSPNVAIFHSYFHLEYYFVVKNLIKRNIPFFIEPHGSFGSHAMNKSYYKKILANKTIFSKLLNNAIGYIFTNKKEYEDSIYHSNNDLIIPNGVFENIISNTKVKIKCDENNLKFYFLGRFDIHHKGIDYLLDSLKILDERKEKINFNIYGIGNNQEIDFIKNNINTLKNINVKLHGPISGDIKNKVLEDNNILVLTSRFEGSPMTVLDALSYGNPCLVTKETNVAEELENNSIGWKTELDPNKIADSIIRAKREYLQKTSTISLNCKKYVFANYEWSKIASFAVEQLTNVLEREI